MKTLYTEHAEDRDDVMTVERFKRDVRSGMFTDYDGFGHPARGRKMNPSITVKPSRVNQIPDDATHVVWFNK